MGQPQKTGLSCSRITRDLRAIPLIQASDEAWRKVACDREEAFAQAGEDDEGAVTYEMMVVADGEAYQALKAFAGHGLGGVVVAADTLAAGHFQEAMGGDQVAVEEPPVPSNLEEAVYVPLERMHQMALLYQFLGWSPRSVSAQAQMPQELATPQMVGNYQAGDYQNLVHYSLEQITQITASIT